MRGAGWYEAADAAAQEAEVAALVRAAREDRDWGAVSGLIELVHLARHARARLPLIEALGRCRGMVTAIPALEGELDDPDPAVVAAALEAIGRVGLAYGGAVVARWLSDQDPEALAPALREAALLALARVGHRELGPRVEEALAAGLLDPAHAHRCLAVAVETRCLDHARALLAPGAASPDAVQAAVLHLAAVEDPLLPDLLDQRAADGGAALAALAGVLAAARARETEALLVALFSGDTPSAGLPRLARTLRARPLDEVLATVDVLADLADPHTADGRRALVALLAAGVPALQDRALAIAAVGPPAALAKVLGRVHSPTDALARGLPGWRVHDDDGVTAAAVRATVNLWGAAGLEELDGLAASERTVHRLEWVRACQNCWRHARDRDGRTTLPRDLRRPLEQRLRTLLRSDPAVPVRRLALYVVGNLGLTALADDLGRVLREAPERDLRQAAAASLAEIPAGGQLPALAEALAEEHEEVVAFRIHRALLRALGEADRCPPALVETVRARRTRSGPRGRLLLTGVLGRCGDGADVPTLAREVKGGPHPVACAALTALGRIGGPAALPILRTSLTHEAPERRLRAAEALGLLRGAARGDHALPADADEALARDLAARLCDSDEATDVRAAARDALAAAPLPEAVLEDIAAPGPDDPFVVDILQLRVAQGAGRDAAAVDERLAEAIPGFDPVAFGRRCPDALRALRTAEYFSLPGAALPAGLDAATPVLFWVKGLELWLHDRLAPIQQAVAGGPAIQALDAIADDWGGMLPELAPGWDPERLPGSHAQWSGLARGTARKLRHRGAAGTVLSLTAVGGLLVAGAEASAARGIGPWSVGLSRDEVVVLANDLVALAARRNALTHKEAASGEDLSAVRRVALACAGRALRLHCRAPSA